MGPEEDSSEYEKRIALALGTVLGDILKSSSNELGKLYIRMHVGGGFFRGRPMTKELARETRYELIPYGAALAAVLLYKWPHRTSPDGPILHHFENMIFTLNLEMAKPTYSYYLDRYYHPRSSDSMALPRESIIHSEFVQRLYKMWDLFRRVGDAQKLEYVKALGDLSRDMETLLTACLETIWPKP